MFFDHVDQLPEGSLSHAFSVKGFAVLTETSARQYFGSADAIGKRFKLDGELDLSVAAVIADPAPNTHLPYEILVSYPTMTKDLIGGLSLDQWSLNASGYAYIGFSGAGVAGQTSRRAIPPIPSIARI